MMKKLSSNDLEIKNICELNKNRCWRKKEFENRLWDSKIDNICCNSGYNIQNLSLSKSRNSVASL